ncbi:MAG: phosphatase PAP2 family protein [Clostridia bacterium]|nr:phosphatase PAP2 family protein [Clostridia bacterium]
MKKSKKHLYISLSLLTLFVLWTVLVQRIQVKAIGPLGSSVGFSAINQLIHNLTGVNMTLYIITDWLGLVPIVFAFGFTLLGLAQWIKRKKLLNVDHSILVLGVFYIITIAVYILFEIYTVNYRPILINGYLEVSYPSSTTLLVMCVMPTAIMQLKSRIKSKPLGQFVTFLLAAFTAFMVIGRIVSGVHWISDIIGGALLSAGLVMLYRYFVGVVKNKPL